MTHGLYRVSGRRAYRGHQPGSEFIAQLEPHAERRAITRGDITLLERVTPGIRPGSLTFPAGWLAPADSQSTRAADAALFIEEGS